MITIGLPFYNCEDTLADTIRAVFAQSHDEWELLLVDDGSRDGSLEIARSVSDPRVRVISDGRNLGLAARLNQIADIASGDYLARLDADDLMHPERLARQLRILQCERTSCELVDTGLLSIDVHNQPQGTRCCQAIELTGAGLLRGNTPVHAALLGKTSWFKRNRYDTGMRRAQDFELWSRAFAQGELRVERVPEPLYIVREASPATYAKTKLTYAAVREVLKRVGPSVLGNVQTRFELSKSYAKQVAYFAMSRVHLERKLVAARNRSLSDAEKRFQLAIIRSILKTEVPGLMTPVAV